MFPLNDKEWEIMKTHCEIGFRIANESSELKDIADLKRAAENHGMELKEKIDMPSNNFSLI